MSESIPLSRPPVAPADICVESVGVCPLDRRRVDVAVDLTPCREPVAVELVLVGPGDDEQCSLLLLDGREWMLDKVMHLRRDADPGFYTLHIGVFCRNELVARAARQFSFGPSEAEGMVSLGSAEVEDK